MSNTVELTTPSLVRQVSSIKKKQAAFFASGKTRDIEFRKEMLLKLKNVIEKYETTLLEAVYKDLKKEPFEAYGVEIGIVIADIELTVKKLRSWMKPERVGTSMFHFIGSSYIYPEPYGQTLIIGPWNYPIQLIFQPLIGAMAAGNTAVVKPSEISEHSSALVSKILRETFPEDYIAVVEGGIEPTQALLEEKWDYLFFTGSVTVGKIVYQAAAKHLTPVTLELGGKSPCIIDKDANLDYGMKRLVWGKFINCGQTCVAPDYLLVHVSQKKQVIEKIIEAIEAFYGKTPQDHPKYGRIINHRNTERLSKMIVPEQIVYGGKVDIADKYIAPTLLDIPSGSYESAPAMQEEIFGPILPIVTYETIEEVIAFVNQQQKALALYIFSNNQENIQKVLRNTSFGGGCVNDAVMHLGNSNLPFGGVGESGIGRYHGKFSFDTFSHHKGVLHKSMLVDMPIRYPYLNIPVSYLKRIMKITM